MSLSNKLVLNSKLTGRTASLHNHLSPRNLSAVPFLTGAATNFSSSYSGSRPMKVVRGKTPGGLRTIRRDIPSGKKGLKTKRDTDFQWKRFPFSAIFTWCSTIGGKYYTCRAFKSDWLALDLLRRIQICNLSSAILSCGQSWEHSCSLLCDPGMNHRQPLLMVESSRAIHSPITLSRGSVFRNEASWCGVTKRHKPQKARLR